MKCSGIKCVTPITTNPFPDFGMPQWPGSMPMPMPYPQPTPNELDGFAPRPPFENFMFKQNNKLGNLRG